MVVVVVVVPLQPEQVRQRPRTEEQVAVQTAESQDI